MKHREILKKESFRIEAILKANHPEIKFNHTKVLEAMALAYGFSSFNDFIESYAQYPNGTIPFDNENWLVDEDRFLKCFGIEETIVNNPKYYDISDVLQETQRLISKGFLRTGRYSFELEKCERPNYVFITRNVYPRCKVKASILDEILSRYQGFNDSIEELKWLDKSKRGDVGLSGHLVADVKKEMYEFLIHENDLVHYLQIDRYKNTPDKDELISDSYKNDMHRWKAVTDSISQKLNEGNKLLEERDAEKFGDLTDELYNSEIFYKKPDHWVEICIDDKKVIDFVEGQGDVLDIFDLEKFKNTFGTRPLVVSDSDKRKLPVGYYTVNLTRLYLFYSLNYLTVIDGFRPYSEDYYDVKKHVVLSWENINYAFNK